MKKIPLYIGTILISLAIVFIVFQLLSWYNFGDIPTKIVLIRMMACFCILEGLQLSIMALISTKKNKKGK